MQGAVAAQMLTNLTPIPPKNVSRRYTIAFAAGVAAILLRWLLICSAGTLSLFTLPSYIARAAYCAVLWNMSGSPQRLAWIPWHFYGSRTHATRSR